MSFPEPNPDFVDLECPRGLKMIAGKPQNPKKNTPLGTHRQKTINHIFFLNVNKDTIINRIEKRKVLENRSDDELETILKRYDTYMETTRPVLDYYSKNPNFHEIDGTQEIDEITKKIDTFINV